MLTLTPAQRKVAAVVQTSGLEATGEGTESSGFGAEGAEKELRRR